MENHTELSLSDLRRYIIRYGAKYMEAFESDLYYDCKAVEELNPGESVFWMVSAMHTPLYSSKEIHEKNLSVPTIAGNRFNYLITCVDRHNYSMKRVGDFEIAMLVNKYQSTLAI